MSNRSRRSSARSPSPGRGGSVMQKVADCRDDLRATLVQMSEASVLRNSLRPRSAEHDFQLLEFYGDSVLYNHVSRILVVSKRWMTPHFLTLQRSATVRNDTLAECFDMLDLAPLVEEELEVPKDRADVVEAIIGELDLSPNPAAHDALEALISFIASVGEGKHVVPDVSQANQRFPARAADADDDPASVDDAEEALLQGRPSVAAAQRSPGRRTSPARGARVRTPSPYKGAAARPPAYQARAASPAAAAGGAPPVPQSGAAVQASDETVTARVERSPRRRGGAQRHGASAGVRERSGSSEGDESGATAAPERSAAALKLHDFLSMKEQALLASDPVANISNSPLHADVAASAAALRVPPDVLTPSGNDDDDDDDAVVAAAESDTERDDASDTN